MKLKSYFPATIDIDGEPIRLRIKRQSPEEAYAFRADGDRFTTKGEEIPLSEHAVFLIDLFEKFVTVEPEQIYLDEATESITTGAAFVHLFGARHDILSRVIQMIGVENSATPEQKAKFYAPPTPVTVPTVKAEEPVADGAANEAPAITR